MGTLFDLLIERLDGARNAAAGSQVPPVALLWPDRNREWEKLIPLVSRRVEVAQLGDYRPGSLTGPSVWLRCLITGTVDLERPRRAGAAVVYLPGVGRDDLRAVEECPDHLKPLAELSSSQRATVFGHQNGKDWTLHGWLTNKERGAGLAMGADAVTAEALTDAIAVLMEQPLDAARTHHWGPAELLALLHPDLTAEVLRWLSDEDGYRSIKTAEGWHGFVQSVKQKLKVDPEGDGTLVAAEHLAERQGDWAQVWARFAEAPSLYPGVELLLRRATPSLAPRHFDSWPQVSDQEENRLRTELAALGGRAASDARDALESLEEDHGVRRSSIWETPLADALGHLIGLAKATRTGLGGPDVDALSDLYADQGWIADNEYLLTVGSVTRAADLEAVRAAAGCVYLPWLEESARHLQGLLIGASPAPTPEVFEAGTCLLFVDGLRFDLGMRLAEMLGSDQIEVALEHRLAGLPTLTATAKAAVMPIAGDLGSGSGFDPTVAEGGAAFSMQAARRLLRESGWQWLEAEEAGDPTGRAWTQVGDIDKLGHEVHNKLVASIDQELEWVAQRVDDLLSAGWRQVVVLTDHGWLLLPAPPDKVGLPKDAAEPRMARCARLKPMAAAGEAALSISWTWDPSVAVAYPPGIRVFVAGGLFHHGGISPQEVVVPRLTCTRSVDAAPVSVSIVESKWVGHRLRAELSGDYAGRRLDLRRKATDASSSVAAGPVEVDAEGRGSVLLADDSLVGEGAILVVLAPGGVVVTMTGVILGGS